MTSNQLRALAEQARTDAALSTTAGGGGDIRDIIEAEVLAALLESWADASASLWRELGDVLVRAGDDGRITESDVEAILATMAERFGDLGGGEAGAREAASAAYESGRLAPLASSLPPPSSIRTRTDARAVGWLGRHHTYWVGTLYDRQLAKRVEAVGEAVLSEGLSRANGGKRFQEALGDLADRSALYWEGFSANLVTRSLEMGRVERYSEAGVELVVIDAVRDDRTSCQCNVLDGKTLRVADLAVQQAKLVASTDPEAIRKLAPWPTCKNVERLYAEGRIGMPPYHYHCRTRTRLATAEESSRHNTEAREFLASTSPPAMANSEPRPLPPLQADAAEYEEIISSETGGSLAYHESWRKRQRDFSPGRGERDKLDREEATAIALSDRGLHVELNYDAAKALDRDADAYVSGVPAQLKATTGTTRNTWQNRLRSDQADLIYLHALAPVREREVALRKLRIWAHRNNEKELWVLLGYETPPRLIRIEP